MGNTFKLGKLVNGLNVLDNGNVGIGVASPSTTLHLSTTNGIRLQYPGNTGFIQFSTNGSNDYIFSGYDGERMRMTSAGNIGVGTSNANDKFVVQSSANVWAAKFIANTTTNDAFGVQIFAGTTSSDTAFRILNAATTSTYLFVRGDGNIGIGTSSPSSKLGVKSSGADGIVLEQDLSDANNSGRLFFLSTTQNYGVLNNAGDLRFTYGAQPGNTSGTSLARFTNTGKYFRMESGTGGIQFQGTTSSNSALNYYEQGTWTPVFTNSGTTPNHITQYGRYTRVGRMVHVVGKISASNLSGGSVIYVEGLPFAAGETGDAGQRVSIRPEGDWGGFVNTSQFSSTMFRISGAVFQGVKDSGSGSSAYAVYSSYGSTLNFNFNATYYV
jgi:hypothetical protein